MAVRRFRFEKRAAGWLAGWGAALALLPVPQAARAWGETGHMLVAEIAYQRLSPAAKARVDALIPIQAEPESATFTTASCWPDDIKRYGLNAFDMWHYTNKPHSPDRTPLPKGEAVNIAWAMNQCVRTLKHPASPDLEKARMLRMLIHLVGDVHQPLHCSSRYTQARSDGDRGGNDYLLRGGARNLHSYWDGGIGQFRRVERPLPEDGEPIRSLANAMMQEFPPEELTEWRDRRFSEWVNEGWKLSKSLCYTLPENAAPPQEYIQKAQPVARKRVVLAGYRLADLLNRIFA